MNIPDILRNASALLGAIGGIGVILVGVSRWFGSLWLGRAMESYRALHEKELETLRSKYTRELEFYKTHLERSVLVTRVQFETEFNAMKQVFQKLSQVRLRMASLRPVSDVSEAAETQEQWKAKRFQRLQEDFEKFLVAYNDLVAVVEDLSPFYPIGIYGQLKACLGAASAEEMDIRLTGSDAVKYEGFKQGRINMKDFNTAFDKVSELIRDRISHLMVIPGIS
jgi:hypothetical protein